MEPHKELSVAIGHAVKTLPDWAVDALVNGLQAATPDRDLRELRTTLVETVVLQHHRSSISKLFAVWRSTASHIAPGSVALALQCTAETHRQSKCEPEISLVWTGPRSQTSPLRSIEQSLLDVIRGAQQSLLLVTFAAYRVPMLQVALTAAITRGVDITFVGETSRPDDDHPTFDLSHALGEDITKLCTIYIWPHALREPSPSGYKGALHAKCAIADDNTILISSANLTDAALANNMELGVVIRNGGLPLQAKRHFDHLIVSGVLKRWSPDEPQ